jgi:arginine-tRNA-protein transferase
LPLLHFRESPRTCSYLPDETAALEYRYLLELSPDACQQYLDQGWRRFGRVVFRPRCPTCTSCRSLRVDVAEFRPSKSQRRCLSRNERITFRAQRAGATAEHVRLFNAYHRDMQIRRGWPEHQITLEEYQAEFVDPAVSFAWEMLYFRGTRLIGVGLVDVLPAGLSSVYFYHDPEWRQAGPGTFSILCEIEWARELARPYLYLGYWIERCPSMNYKSRFTPHELLSERVGTQMPAWIRPAEGASRTARPD